MLARRRGATRRDAPGKKLHDLLSSAERSLASAAELTVTLNATEVADEIQKLKDQARLVGAKADAEFARRSLAAAGELPAH